MATLIQRIAAQVYRTFVQNSPTHPRDVDISRLRSLTNSLSASDVNFSPSLVSDTSVYIFHGDIGSQSAPVQYIKIWEDSLITMSIFVVRNGARLPLHDHPEMYGLIKVIHGTLQLRTYTTVPDQDFHADAVRRVVSAAAGVAVPRGRRVLVRRTERRVDSGCGVLCVTPDTENYHELTAVEGPAAFVDILSPSYPNAQMGPRACHYYSVEKLPSQGADGGLREEEDLRVLVEIRQPCDFWTAPVEYSGPRVDPYEESVV